MRAGAEDLHRGIKAGRERGLGPVAHTPASERCPAKTRMGSGREQAFAAHPGLREYAQTPACHLLWTRIPVGTVRTNRLNLKGPRPRFDSRKSDRGRSGSCHTDGQESGWSNPVPICAHPCSSVAYFFSVTVFSSNLGSSSNSKSFQRTSIGPPE